MTITNTCIRIFWFQTFEVWTWCSNITNTLLGKILHLC